MKIAYYTILLATITLLGFGRPHPSWATLRAEAGEEARLLLVALEKMSPKDIHRHAVALIRSGKPDLVIGALGDCTDDGAIGLSGALAETRQYQAIPPLIVVYERLSTVFVRGGTETQALREEAVATIETSLAEMMGITLDPNWTVEDKSDEFRRRVPDFTKERIPPRTCRYISPIPEPPFRGPLPQEFPPASAPANDPPEDGHPNERTRDIAILLAALLVTGAVVWSLKGRGRAAGSDQ